MVTIEQIDEFRKRTNSSYEDARIFLERHQGDVLEAIIDFEKAKAGWRPPVKKPQHKGEFGRWFMELLQKGFDLRMTVEDKAGKLLFTVPILLLLLLTPAWPLLLFTCLFLILLGFKLGFRDIKSTAVNVKEIFDSLGTQLRDVGTQQPHGGAHGAPNGFAGGMGQPGQQRYGGSSGQPGAFGWPGAGASGAQAPSGQGAAPGQNGPAGSSMTTQSFGRTGAVQKPNAMPNQSAPMPSQTSQMPGAAGAPERNGTTTVNVTTAKTTQQAIGFIQPANLTGAPPVGQVMTLPADPPIAQGQPTNLQRRHEDRLRPLAMESRFGSMSAPSEATVPPPSVSQPAPPAATQVVPQSFDMPMMVPGATAPDIGFTGPETQSVTDFYQEDDGFNEFTIE